LKNDQIELIIKNNLFVKGRKLRKLSALISLALVSTLIISAPGNANPARGNSANAPGQQATPTVTVDQAESTQAAAERANRAAAAAAAAKAAREAQEVAAAEAAQQKTAAEAKAKSEAAQASQAAQAATRAERDENPAAASEARARAESAMESASKAAVDAKGKAVEAQEKAVAVREAKKEELAAMRVARALGKIKSADEDCLEFVENPSASPECQTTRYVIRFQNGVDPDFQVRGMRAIKIPVQATLRGVFSGAVADLNAGQLRALVNSARIRSVEADFEVKLAQTQNNAVWGIDRVDQPALPLSNTFTSVDQGAGVTAYVVDTGVLTTHQEFSGRVLPGFTAISDGRGVTDCNGHGTHVAGTIAGTTYGVAKAANIVPVRVLDCNGSGFLSSVVSGLDFVARNNAAGSPAVVNLSLGGGASSTLDAAVENLVSRGITVVVAAGNSAISACDASPARTPGALTIAASDINDRFATFSNFGSCVDMVAPGVSVTSAWISNNTSAQILSGTSMAAPHVAGLAAVLMTKGYLQPSEVEFRLESAAVATVAGLPSGTPNLLAQLVAAPAPVQEPVADEPAAEEPAPQGPELPEQFQTVPVSPTITGVNLSRNTARVFWSIAPDGGSPLTGHVLRIWERGQLVKKIDVSATATDAVAKGLKWGVNYTFTVLAVNAIGASEDSQVSEIFTPRR
jgi:subtilisin family serine protease